ncbi:MAG TPA: ROK family protein [Actinophytocola sp.]|uniref:ROK family protein n=1 Tax=Actinophytocola sp. TaxID=1872138 RepID=UPI002DDD7F7D|nr:ROK family protein [Actinophytocola sp.]HEV2779043.1 ROK family protein [Actinophytocola sp.]
MARTVLALDVGGTKIAAGIVDETGAILAGSSRPTPAGDDPEVTFDAVRAATDEVLDAGEIRVDAVGISCAGPVDLIAGTVSPINIASWRGFPLRDRMRELLDDVPVELAGDGLCMAMGEHWAGAGRGSGSMLGMVVSTGVGGGLVLGGQPFPGRTGNAAHVGHVVVEPADGLPCSCGGRGCVETVASGPNLVRWARRQGWQAPEHADAAHLAAAATAGDELPRAAFRRGGRAVALAVVAAAAVCDLELTVIGGGVAQAGDLLFEPLRETLAEHARLSFLDELRVLPATLGSQAGLIGAAGLALGAREAYR